MMIKFIDKKMPKVICVKNYQLFIIKKKKLIIRNICKSAISTIPFALKANKALVCWFEINGMFVIYVHV